MGIVPRDYQLYVRRSDRELYERFLEVSGKNGHVVADLLSNFFERYIETNGQDPAYTAVQVSLVIGPKKYAGNIRELNEFGSGDKR